MFALFRLEDGKNEIKPSTYQQKYYVNQPVLESMDIGERVKKFTERGFLWWGCNKLIRREFLIENKINFPPISVWEDLVFAFMCVICAKNYVRVPNIFYYYRLRSDSLSHRPNDPFNMIETLTKVVKVLDEFMSGVEFFKKNPQFRYMFLDWHIQARLNILCKFFYEDNKIPPFRIDELFRKKFSSANLQDCLAFMSYFFVTTSSQRYMLYKMNAEKAALNKKLSEMEMELAKYKVGALAK